MAFNGQSGISFGYERSFRMNDDGTLIKSLARVEREVARLARDVETLLQRTEGALGKQAFVFPTDKIVGGARPVLHERTIGGHVEDMRESVRNSEYGISAIRAILDDAEKLKIAGMLKKK
jgi:hypothetical protein